MVDKVVLGVYITKELDQKFREFLVLKYRRIARGMISDEVEQALGHWVALHTKAQKSLLDKVPNPVLGVSKAYLVVKQYLLSQYYDVLEPGVTIPERYLKEAIAQTRGSDKRTITKWLKTFSQMHLIKPINASIWELAA